MPNGEPENRLAGFIREFRKSLLGLSITLIFGTATLYFFSPALMTFLQDHLDQDLAFFAVAEAFLAHVKLALAVTILLFLPLILFWLWRALARPFNLSRRSMIWFVVCSCLLFYAGAAFCYFVTLPYGVRFLLGFQSAELKPLISIGKFVTFVTVFILAFGLIFELPLFMVFAARTGLCPRTTFERNRRYALLAISIIAALLTPTPDIVNMLLMGGPLYLLYEFGIITLKVMRI